MTPPSEIDLTAAQQIGRKFVTVAAGEKEDIDGVGDAMSYS